VLSRTDLKAADWAAGVDAVNIFPVSAGDFPYFCVVSRAEVQYFRRSTAFQYRFRFPAAPLL